MKRTVLKVLLIVALVTVSGMARFAVIRMGRQPDESFLVSSGQRIERGALSFRGRPIDLALNPTRLLYAVLSQDRVLLGTPTGVREETAVPLNANAGFRGLVWSPDGSTLFASTNRDHVQRFRLIGDHLERADRLQLPSGGVGGDPVPGGMVFTRDGKRLFIALANRNAVVEMDLVTGTPVREHAVENLPFEPRLSKDERFLIVSNWGGRLPRPGDLTAKSQNLDIVVDERGAPASGTVSLIDRQTGQTRHVDVGIHPTSISVSGDRAYVANAMSDTISEIDVPAGQVTRTISLRWRSIRIVGSMPNALAIHGDTLFVAGGGDNAVGEVDLPSGNVRGFRPAGYFPTAIAIDPDGKMALVLNTKGNGSVQQTLLGKPGNAHDFQGTVSVIDLTRDLTSETNLVARNNRWDVQTGVPPLKVYNGGIKHVLYIIKENRTYDEVFGDLPIGEGDPNLCSLGETVMPNHRKIAKQFTLFDNGYVCGTNSADGHAWSTQCLANDYLEHFYVGYSRTYPDDGDCAMSISTGGALWDAAVKRGLTVRVWGEFCDEKLGRIEPKPKDWFEVWEDRRQGTNRFRFTADTTVAGLKPLISKEVLYWPLLQSDQHRADVFIRDYKKFSRDGAVPSLMILSLPCDHGEGLDPRYPTPRAMMADNDLALGRIVEAVAASPEWKETCVFVVEDDAQSGPDHIDGHRTVFMAISPFNRMSTVDSTFYTQANMIRSIEMMLGMAPMNRFDAVAYPMTACFTDVPNLAPFRHVQNHVPLDERNPSAETMTTADRFWQEKSLSLDWGHIDGADPYWLNRINWYSFFREARPYPGRPGEQPGLTDTD